MRWKVRCRWSSACVLLAWSAVGLVGSLFPAGRAPRVLSSVAVCLSRFVAPAKLATLARRVLHEHMPPSPKRTNQAPTAACPGLLCHLCGKQFGSASLEIHQRTCRLRFEREHGRAAPEAPAGGDNEAAAQFYESEVMEACPHCARTFQPGRLEVHLRSCGKGKPPLQAPERTAGQKLEAAERSALPVCHLCGRQFGSASLEIHQRTCRLRFEREHGRAAPEAPAGGDNEAATHLFESEVMEACPHCARTFLPGRLEVHLRSCKGPATPRSSPAPSPCPVCSRLLTPAQMLGHSRLCKAPGATPPRLTSTAGASPSSGGLARVSSVPTVGSAPPTRLPTKIAAPGSAARGRGGGPSASAARLPLPRPSPARQPSGPPRQARTEGRDAALTPEGTEGQCSSSQRTGPSDSAALSRAQQQAARGDIRARLEHASAEGASRGRARAGGSGPAVAADASASAKAGRGRGGGRPVHERLVELNALLEASLITEEECRVKREQILAEL